VCPYAHLDRSCAAAEGAVCRTESNGRARWRGRAAARTHGCGEGGRSKRGAWRRGEIIGRTGTGRAQEEAEVVDDANEAIVARLMAVEEEAVQEEAVGQ
jgi:hypothetical protein